MEVNPLVNMRKNYGNTLFCSWVNQLFRLGHVQKLCLFTRCNLCGSLMFYHHFKHVSLQHALLDASVYGCDISMRSEWDCDGIPIRLKVSR